MSREGSHVSAQFGKYCRLHGERRTVCLRCQDGKPCRNQYSPGQCCARRVLTTGVTDVPLRVQDCGLHEAGNGHKMTYENAVSVACGAWRTRLGQAAPDQAPRPDLLFQSSLYTPDKALRDQLFIYRPEQHAGPILPGQDERAYDGFMFLYGSDAESRRQVQSKAFLLDAVTGKIVHEWRTEFQIHEGSNAYLLNNGLTVRAVSNRHWRELASMPIGANGRLEIVDWEATCFGLSTTATWKNTAFTTIFQ